MTKRPYTKHGRLADVLALIQVLAFDPFAHRSESGGSKPSGGIRSELGEPSSSPEGWIALAKEHPEMFRVSKDGDNLSLVARHVQPKDESDRRDPLSEEFTNVLVRTALDLHEREVNAAEWWKNLLPLCGVLLGGALAIGSQFITSRWGHSATSGRFVHAGEPYPDAILLDTATGRYCYGDIVGQKNPSNIPSCKDIR